MAETLSHVDARLTRHNPIMCRYTVKPKVHCTSSSGLLLGVAMLAAMLFSPNTHAALDFSHARLDALLQQHVVWTNNGCSSQVDYAAIKRERSALRNYLDEVAAVTQKQYLEFSKAEKLAFLINAYNAYTIDFILTEYPDIKSIRELGSLFRSPWKKRLFPLLGSERSLDDIEHKMIRKPGEFDDPRIHMAVNCASIGCPALRNEAYVAHRLDTQLDDAVRRFLSDRSRNRAEQKGLWVSKLFDWYASDFEKQAGSVNAWLAPYAEQLTDDEQTQFAAANRSLRIRYLDYDWALNDLQETN